VRGAKGALEGVEGQGEEELVHGHGSQFGYLLVLSEVSEVGEGEQVLLEG
jgi:hypothetical protein